MTGSWQRTWGVVKIAALRLLLAASLTHALGWCVYENAVVKSGVIDEGQPGDVTDSAACLFRCTRNPDCNAFSYDLLQGKCTLHDLPDNTKPAPGDVRQPSLFVINDNRAVPCFADLVDGCIVPDADYAGGNLNLPGGNGLETASLEDCVNKCEINVDCLTYTFDTGSRKCWLKVADQLVPPRDITSGRVRGIAASGCPEYYYDY